MADLLARLSEPGPKRILALDGGGIRGCITLGYLERIERIVRDRMGASARLADYFDLIGGTSTGAIIATLLALGNEVEDVKKKYLGLGPKVFSKPTALARLPLIGKALFTKLSVKPLEQEAKAFLSEDTTLGSERVQTGLCIVTKRADTFSTWPYLNHPNARFYGDNADIPLWKLIRASSAAPTYFRPIELDVGVPDRPNPGVFIDGGISMANNPALILFMAATLSGFPFHWSRGKDELLLVSIGTGRWDRRLSMAKILKSENLYWAKNVPDMLMHDASDQNEMLLQYMSDSPTARQIDLEVGDLGGDLLCREPLFTYLRYNAVLDEAALRDLGRTVSAEQVDSLRDMSIGGNAMPLYEIGRDAAASAVSDDHFPARFDRESATPSPTTV